MPTDLNELVEEFRQAIVALLANCSQRGVIMRPYQGVRSPFDQARLWRQSRTREEIEARTDDLRAANATFLARCIASVGPQNGPPVTNAIPGLSWHQWGEAVDCFWVVDGRAQWSSRLRINGLNGYQVYAEEAAKLGLTPGDAWKLKDWPHVQLRVTASPAADMPLSQISAEMAHRFPG